MCGLCGAFGLVTHGEKEAVSNLLYFNRLRGKHSTGLTTVRFPTKFQEGAVETIKSLGSFLSLVFNNPKEFTNEIRAGWWNVMIGHCRHATQGAITAETAHPFEFDNIIGAHNGTVLKSSLKDFPNSSKYEIDSQMIFAQIDSDSDVQKLWDKADGAMALTWWDKQNNKLHIVKNKERELHYCFSKNTQTLFWASEEWMLEVALKKNRVQHDPIEAFENDTLYTFSYDNYKITTTKDKLSPFVPPKITYHNNHKGSSYAAWWGGMGQGLDEWDDEYPVGKSNLDYTGGGGGGSTTMGPPTEKDTPSKWIYFKILEFDNGVFWGTSSLQDDVMITLPNKGGKNYDDEKKKIIEEGNKTFWKVKRANIKHNVHGDYQYIEIPWWAMAKTNMKDTREEEAIGFKGEKLSASEFQKRTNCTCSNCKNPMAFATRGKIVWLSENEAVCKDCSSLPLVQEALATLHDVNNNRMN